MRLVILSAVGKPLNVMCFENGSDNLFPNPLIGSQCGLLRTYKAALAGGSSGHRESLKRNHLHLGDERAFHYSKEAFKQVLGCESFHVKSITY